TDLAPVPQLTAAPNAPPTGGPGCVAPPPPPPHGRRRGGDGGARRRGGRPPARPSEAPQRPTKRASRFSVKALMPSFASSLEKRIANRSASCTRLAPRSPCSERFAASFA